MENLDSDQYKLYRTRIQELTDHTDLDLQHSLYDICNFLLCLVLVSNPG
jgi:hypothetical protein